MAELTPYYTVVEPDSSKNFEIRFYEESFDHNSEFTFDDPERNDWVCDRIDDSNHLIYAEPMSDFTNRIISDYHTKDDRKIPENITYVYIDYGS